ncbi:hypothetical protein [Rhodoferax antarcticus]|uniref:hypothetical protein n=1 Tax=Rhodoferax antarcticus TaxID=81479 RepID=UPI002224B6EB|nr:hypothetical protein [Rhodoferax antarcticus]
MLKHEERWVPGITTQQISTLSDQYNDGKAMSRLGCRKEDDSVIVALISGLSHELQAELVENLLQTMDFERYFGQVDLVRRPLLSQNTADAHQFI